MKGKCTVTVFARYAGVSAYLPAGWANNVVISVDSKGWIVDIETDCKDNSAIQLNGPILPGMSNLHSHAFQRAMAGLAERSTGEKDSFWTWREIMYSFLQKLTPEDLQTIAAQLYVEMLKAGFTAVGEFHYLHHQSNGKPYEERALTSHHIIAAAKETGIAITHLPVLYAHSGFDGKELLESQKRFQNDTKEILNIIESLNSVYRDDPQVTIGLAHHSLRAVTPLMLQEATDGMRAMNAKAPIHIHIAEQLKEVDDCLAWSGQRPVEWLMNHIDVDANWCLVHATHLSDIELQRLANSDAIAGLCPTTEANLGDGIFNLPDYMRAQGVFGIGSDSHCSVSVIEELRLLEYGQRLLRRERAVAKKTGETSIGKSLYTEAMKGGVQALSRSAGSLEVGKRADFIALDPENPALLYKEADLIFDALIFAGNVNPIRHVVVGGQHVVKDYRHAEEEKILAKFRVCLQTDPKKVIAV